MEVLNYINTSMLISYRLEELCDNKICIQVNNLEEFVSIVTQLELTGKVYMPSDVRRDKEALYNRGKHIKRSVLIERRKDLGECEYILRYYASGYISAYGYTIKECNDVTIRE